MKQKPFIILPTEEGKEIINPEDILAICSNNKNVIITTEEDEKLKVKLSLGAMEEMLDKEVFIRCHRSHIINMLKIKKILGPYQSITLKNNTQLPIARANKSLFVERFMQLFERNNKKGKNNNS